MPRKDSSWIGASGLYGTWTFTTQTMTDVGYYKGNAYVVVHLMPDPMQVKSCSIDTWEPDANHNNDDNDSNATGSTTGNCSEADNKACSHGKASGDEGEECVDTETTELEWSDVTAFFQFGFRLREGIVRKTYHNINTSDWIGPYNIILAPIESKKTQQPSPLDADADADADVGEHSHTTKKLFVSRYVKTPWTATELQRPFTTASIFDFDADVLENIAGTTAINSTIHEQIHWRGQQHGSKNHIKTQIETQIENKDKTKDTNKNWHEPFGNDENDAVLQNGGGLRGDSENTYGENNNYDYDNNIDYDYDSETESDDPYARHAKTCAHGDLRPVLPRITLEQTTKTTPAGPDGNPPEKSTTSYAMKFDYSMLSVPVKGVDDLYRKWPAMKSHLGEHFPVTGPYCYGKDPHRAYTIRLNYDSSESNETAVWKGIKGCQRPWPCWEGDVPANAPTLPPSAKIPTDNHSPGAYVLDPMGLEFALLYGMGFLLVVSLVFNLQLANRLTRLRQSVGGSRGTPEQAAPPPPPPTNHRHGAGGGFGMGRSELQEPLLASSSANHANDVDVDVDVDDLLSSSFDHPQPHTVQESRS